MFIGGLLAWALVDSYGEQRRIAVQNASNLAAALSEEIRQEISQLDSSLLAAVEGWKNPGVAALNKTLQKLVLFDRSAFRQSSGSIYIIDASGSIVLEAGSDERRNISLADRSYFKAHRDQDEAGLVISEPIQSRLDGQWLIGLTRRLDNPDGSFGGVVIASIALSHFQSMFDRLAMGTSGAITLAKLDGSIIARSPFSAAHIGRNLAAAFPTSILASSAGTYDATSPIDGIERIYGFRRIGALPYVQVVGFSKADIFASWWRKAALIGSAFVVLASVVCGVMVLFVLELRKRRRAEIELAHAARTDALTGVGNRRHFEERLAYEWQRALKTRGRLALLMIDVDHFKSFNDRYGHVAGDRALSIIGGCLAERARPELDTVARYGGEEFALIVPDASQDAATRIARLLQKDLSGAAPLHHQSSTGFLTISIGVVGGPAASFGSKSEFLKAADDALYAAKRAGRDAVCNHVPKPRASEQAA